MSLSPRAHTTNKQGNYMIVSKPKKKFISQEDRDRDLLRREKSMYRDIRDSVGWDVGAKGIGGWRHLNTHEDVREKFQKHGKKAWAKLFRLRNDDIYEHMTG